MSDSLTTSSPNAIESQIRSFFADRISKSASGTISRLNETLSKIDFSNIERKSFSKDVDILILPINDINVHDFTKLNRASKSTIKADGGSNTGENTINHSVSKAVFYLKNDKVIYGNIVEISSPVYQKQDIETNFTNIILKKKKDFTGHISVNSLSQKLNSDWGYKNGVIVSSTTVKSGATPSNSTNGIRTAACIAWYLHIDYYIMVDNEYIIYNSTDNFIGTTGCGSENQGFEPPTESGGGGEPTPPDTTCAQSKRLSEDLLFGNAVTELKDSTGLNYEIGYTMVKNPMGGFNYTKVRSAPNTSTMSVPNINMDGFLHNHHVNDMMIFSPTDLQFMYLLMKTGHMNNTAEFTMGVVLPSGQMQLLRISNAANFLTFGDTYLGLSQFPSWEASVAASLTSSDYISNTIALINIISSAGLTLYEGDANNITNGFKKLENKWLQ